MLMHGHTLIWHWNSEIPEFMNTYTGDWKTKPDKHAMKLLATTRAELTAGM